MPTNSISTGTVTPFAGRRALNGVPPVGALIPFDDTAFDRARLDWSEPTIEIKPLNVVMRRASSWNGMKAEIVHAAQRQKLELHFRSPWHLLVLYEEGARSDGDTLVEGSPRATLRDLKRKLTFVPAGREFRESHDPRMPMRIVCLYIDPKAMPTGPDGNETRALSPKVFFESQALRETALKLVTAVENGSESNRGYLEALGAVLTHELVRLNDGIPARQAPARGGLAGWQQRVVTTYIEEHLDETVPLAKLAELARLSQFYFARAFKESFGLPPHRYHTGRRIERAKALLARSSQSITEIGLEVGFSETSSFTVAFRKTTGQTPSAYRRSLA